MGMVFVLIGKDTSSHHEGGADDGDDVNAHMFFGRVGGGAWFRWDDV